MSKFFKALEQAERERALREQARLQEAKLTALAPRGPAVAREDPPPAPTSVAAEPPTALPVHDQPEPASQLPRESPDGVKPMTKQDRGLNHTLLHYQSLASTIQGFISKGIQKLVITSSGPTEGKSTIASNLGRALAKCGKGTVVLVDADQFKPTLHTFFAVENHPGIGEALKEVYQVEITDENAQWFGLGDWLELLRVQARTGRLLVAHHGQEFSLLLRDGRISRIDWQHRPEDMRLGNLLVTTGRITEEQRATALRLHQDTHEPFGDVLCALGYAKPADVESALHAQLKDSLYRIFALRDPVTRFFEATDRDRCSEIWKDCAGDALLASPLRTRAKQPFLSGQLSTYLKDTDVANLKLLTSGNLAYDLHDRLIIQQFKAMLDTLCRTFDIVLIDSPPVALTSPAASLAALADGVLFVVKSDALDIRTIQQAKQALDKVKANLLGVVFNAVDIRDIPEVSYYYGATRK